MSNLFNKLLPINAKLSGYIKFNKQNKAIVINLNNFAITTYSDFSVKDTIDTFIGNDTGLYQFDNATYYGNINIVFPKIDTYKGVVKYLENVFCIYTGSGIIYFNNYPYQIPLNNEVCDCRIKLGKGLKDRFITVKILSDNIKIYSLTILFSRQTIRRR